MLCSESELNLSSESEGIIELKNKEKEIGKSYFKGSYIPQKAYYPIDYFSHINEGKLK